MVDRLRAVAGIAALSCCAGLIATLVSAPLPRLVWNASASAPIGLYRMMPGSPIRVGDMVIARLPAPMRMLAARRHYLPLGLPLVKRVVAGAGDRVCASAHVLSIDGRTLVHRRDRDRRGRALPRWHGCRTLADGQVLLVMTRVPDSFDGRYFGPTLKRDLLGRAIPLWLR